MSNTTPVVYDVAPETENQPQPKKNKHVAVRIFSAIFLALCVASLILPILLMKGVDLYVGEGFALLGVILAFIGLPGAEAPTFSLFGFLPSFADPAASMGMLNAVAVYVLILAIVLTVIFAIIGIFSGKAGVLRAAAYTLTLGASLYFVATFIPYYQTNGLALDIAPLLPAAIMLVGGITYFVLSACRAGAKAWMSLLQFILTLAACGAILLNVTVGADAFANGLATFGVAAPETVSLISLIITGVVALLVLIASIRISTKIGLVFDLIRYILQFVIAGVLCYFAIASMTEFNNVLLFAIVAVGASLLQIVLCIIQKSVANKAKKKAAAKEAEETEEAPAEEEYVREEYAEALPYEGGVVEGVVVAEEVASEPVEEAPIEPAPAPCAAPAPAVTAGYDFYNSKSFDPFIASLGDKERNEFTELFILKYKGDMPELPDYQVGGDNKEFFRKVFIYLGQYRDKIPDGLLAKIYQFAVRM